jgi:hypothetical protein
MTVSIVTSDPMRDVFTAEIMGANVATQPKLSAPAKEVKWLLR